MKHKERIKMKAYDRITDLIGGTPLLRLNRYMAEKKSWKRRFMGNGVPQSRWKRKDRVAKAMIDDAEAKGNARAGFRHY